MKRLFAIALASMLLLWGCGSKQTVDYVQRQLPQPASIVVTLGTTELTYAPDSPEYQTLVDSLTPNWWKRPRWRR